MNENVDYKLDKPKKGTKFLWWCAGADAKILEYSSYSDLVKYVGIGGVVLATGFMAALSMGFAMHTIFGKLNPQTNEFEGNWFVTISVAIVWALIVFNLDRFIVSSTGKGDGESSISGKELLNALPRLFMAILLGLTISAPLETFIFQKEIQREWKLSMDQLALSKTYEVLQAENKNDEAKIADFNEKKVQVGLQKETWEKANQECVDQMQGRTGTGVGRGERTIALEKVRDAEKVKLDKFEAELKVLEDGKSFNKLRIKKMQDSVAYEIKQSTPGFLDQIMMIERLSSTGKSVPKFDPAKNQIVKGQEIEIYGSAFWPIWLVRLLFMIIEIAPVILKLMLIKGPYDYMTENVNQILETKQGISLQYLPDEHSQIHKLKRNHNPERIIAIIDHQNTKEAENAKEAITAFANKEKEEIAKNPGGFVK
jgi:hypothetical protein